MTQMDFHLLSEPDSEGHRYQFSLPPHILSDSSAACRAAIAPVETWCTEKFGDRPGRSHASRWWSNGFHIWLRDEDDALEFRLRWC